MGLNSFCEFILVGLFLLWCQWCSNWDHRKPPFLLLKLVKDVGPKILSLNGIAEIEKNGIIRLTQKKQVD